MTLAVMINSVRGSLPRGSRAVLPIMAGVASVIMTPSAKAQSLAELKAQLDALQDKVAALESRPAINDALRDKLEKTPVISLDQRGFRIASPEQTETRVVTDADGQAYDQIVTLEEGGAYKFRLGTLLQPQGRFFVETPDDTSTFLMRRARLIADGTVAKNFDFNFQVDLLSSGLWVTNTAPANTVTVQDAWVNAKAWDWLQLRIGKMKSPIGIERWQSANARWFTDLITTTYLAPNRSIGAMLHGNVYGGVAQYWASLVNGEPDGGSSDFSIGGQNTKEFQGRLALTPFARTDWEPLKELTVGAGVTYAPQLNGLGRYGTANQQQFFTYNSSTINATLANPGEQVRFVPNLTYFWGPLGLYAEAAWSTVGLTGSTTSRTTNSVTRVTRVRNTSGATVGTFTTTSSTVATNTSSQSDTFTNFAWQVAASYMLTGEKNSFRAIRPKRPFNPSSGGWGALQVAARAGQLTVDDGIFPVYSNPGIWSRQSTTVGAALNWILNENLKLTLQYDYTSFLGGAPDGGNAPDNNAITTQVQLSF
jgi:phosphate-selective porin OprO/OprP